MKLQMLQWIHRDRWDFRVTNLELRRRTRPVRMVHYFSINRAFVVVLCVCVVLLALAVTNVSTQMKVLFVVKNDSSDSCAFSEKRVSHTSSFIIIVPTKNAILRHTHERLIVIFSISIRYSRNQDPIDRFHIVTSPRLFLTTTSLTAGTTRETQQEDSSSVGENKYLGPAR